MSNDEPNFLLERFFERFHCTYPLNVHDMTLHEMTQIIDAFIFVCFRLFSMFFSLSLSLPSTKAGGRAGHSAIFGGGAPHQRQHENVVAIVATRVVAL